MKNHKHCEIIKAWAEGESIQYRLPGCKGWIDISKPNWTDVIAYRVKPEPIPEVVLYGYAYLLGDHGVILGESLRIKDYRHNLKLTFEVEAGKLVAAEVV